MYVRSIPIVCLLSTSANNGLAAADFPAALSTPSAKPQMDTSGLEQTEACYVSTALISGLSQSLPSPPLRTFQYCNCLRVLAESCGSVYRAPISYAKRMASLRASDTVQTQSPPCQKIATAAYWFRTSSRAHCVSWKTTLRHWDPFHRQSSLWQKPPTARFGWEHSAM